MDTEIKINAVPAKVDVNFKELKAAITGHLEQYDNVVVTEDTVKDSKKLIERINATRKDLEKRRKEAVAKASEPVKLFDAQMKELVSLHDDVIGKIRDQIQQFEKQRKAEILSDLIALRDQLWQERKVADEFHAAECEDLALLGSVTSKGNLNSKTVNELTRRVDADKALQNQTELRLARLEADSYKAGLAAPLNRGHVEHFLFDNDEDYQHKLDALFRSELSREEQAVEHRREQFTKEQDLVEAAVASQRPLEKPTANKVSHTAPDGLEPVTVSCTFHINIGPKVTNEAVRTKIREKLEAAGFTTLSDIEVYRAEQQEVA